MNENVGKKLNDVLSGIDKNKLNGAKKSVEEFLKSSDGQKLREELNSVDKNKLINNFMNMDTNKLKEVLGKANLNNLSGTDVNNILKKFK